MKVAFVHDWFDVNGGAEKVAREVLTLWPDADVYSLVDFLNDRDRMDIMKGKKVHTSSIQGLPFARKRFRYYLFLFPYAIEQFDLTSYDLVISSSWAVAKGVLTHTKQVHICYCHTPMRYAWELYHQYLGESGFDKGLFSPIVKYVLHRLRRWDVSSANRPDYYIANSNNVARRISKIYNRESNVIYPPVEVEQFELREKKEDFYVTASRLVAYKKVDLIVEAFAQMPDKKLVVIGDGPELRKIKAMATDNVEVVGYQTNDKLVDYMQRARAFVLAAEEDFGITSLEAQACGTPVIALGRGGYLETVLDGITGVFFKEQTAESLKEAVVNFEEQEMLDSPSAIREFALRFDRKHFADQIKQFVEDKMPTD